MNRRQYLTATLPLLVGASGCAELVEPTPRAATGPDRHDDTAADGPELLREETVVTDTRYPFDLPADSDLVVEVDVETGGPFTVFLVRFRRAGETPPQPTPTDRPVDPLVTTTKQFRFDIGREGTYYLYVSPSDPGDRAQVRVWLEQ